MHSKMTTNPHQQLNLKNKNKLTNQNRNRITEKEITWRVTRGEGAGETGEKVQGISSNWQVQNRQGEVKNTIGNGESEEFICTTHGYELIRGNTGGWGLQEERNKVREKKTGTTVIA